MKYVKPIVNIIIILLFVSPIVSLFFDFKTSFHGGIVTLASFTVIAIAVGLKSKYRSK